MLKMINMALFITTCFVLGILLGVCGFSLIFNLPLDIPLKPLIATSIAVLVQVTILRRIGAL
jgi:hypothetical protein